MTVYLMMQILNCCNDIIDFRKLAQLFEQFILWFKLMESNRCYQQIRHPQSQIYPRAGICRQKPAAI